MEAAAVSYEECLEIKRALAAENPRAYTLSLCSTINNLSFFYKDNQPDREQSLQLARETLALVQAFRHIPKGEKYYGQAEGIIAYWEGGEEEEE